MKTIIFLLIFLLFIIPISYSAIITTGVSPSEFILHGVGNTSVTLNLFNSRGDTDAIYSFSPDSCLSPYIVSNLSEIIVPVNQTIKYNIKLNGNFSQNKTCYLYIYGRPIGTNETNNTVSIKQGVGVKFIMHQTQPTTTTTRTTTTIHPTTTIVSQSGGNSTTSTTTRTTTTATKTTTTLKNKPKIISTTILPYNNRTKIPILNDTPVLTTTTENNQESNKSGLVHFLMGTEAGLYLIISIIVIIIIVIIFIIQRKKRMNDYNPLLMEN